MANLGISNASYYTDRFITKLNKEVVSSVDRLSTARKNITASDIASLKSMAISSAIESSTDLSSQFSLGSGTLTDLNFSSETAFLARRQIQHDIATAILAQANLGQSNLISLLTQ